MKNIIGILFLQILSLSAFGYYQEDDLNKFMEDFNIAVVPNGSFRGQNINYDPDKWDIEIREDGWHILSYKREGFPWKMVLKKDESGNFIKKSLIMEKSLSLEFPGYNIKCGEESCNVISTDKCKDFVESVESYFGKNPKKEIQNCTERLGSISGYLDDDEKEISSDALKMILEAGVVSGNSRFNSEDKIKKLKRSTESKSLISSIRNIYNKYDLCKNREHEWNAEKRPSVSNEGSNSTDSD